MGSTHGLAQLKAEMDQNHPDMDLKHWNLFFQFHFYVRVGAFSGTACLMYS